MRPSVVLFSEKMYQNIEDKIDGWFDQGPVDLMLVVGTSLAVHPAAGYVNRALESGARVAVIDIEPPDRSEDNVFFGADHWYFQGNAAEVLPDILKGVIGSYDSSS
jgi:NAD+-dependent protein deacetylase sirtuin 5